LKKKTSFGLAKNGSTNFVQTVESINFHTRILHICKKLHRPPTTFSTYVLVHSSKCVEKLIISWTSVSKVSEQIGLVIKKIINFAKLIDSTVRYTLIFLCLLSVLDAIGQKKKVLKKVEAELIKEYSQWYDGSIQLWVVENKIQGLIQFNDKTQVLTFKLEGAESEILKPNEVKEFEFFDDESQVVRNFISLDYPVIESFSGEKKIRFYSLNDMDTNGNVKTTPEFFEIIKKTKNFALISKISSLNSIQGTSTQYTPVSQAGGLPYSVTRNELGQEITLFFYDLTAKLYPAIRMTKIETKKTTQKIKNSFLYPVADVSYSKNPDIDLDEKLLSKLMGNYFRDVKEYMSANKLKCNKVGDLLRIIDYYKKLEGE
jgi:hypothetical protein